MLRISASIQKVPNWGTQVGEMKNRSLTETMSDDHYESSTDPNDDTLNNISHAYIHSVNQLIKQHSPQTAAVFIYLPGPPVSNSWNEATVYSHYLQLLTELTADLPPTILVHGVSAVTSTTL